MYYGEIRSIEDERMEKLSEIEALALSEVIFALSECNRFAIFFYALGSEINWEYAEEEKAFACRFRSIWNSREKVRIYPVKDEQLLPDLINRFKEEEERNVRMEERYNPNNFPGCIVFTFIVFFLLMYFSHDIIHAMTLVFIVTLGYLAFLKNKSNSSKEQPYLELVPTGVKFFSTGFEEGKFMGFYASNSNAANIILTIFQKHGLSIETRNM